MEYNRVIEKNANQRSEIEELEMAKKQNVQTAVETVETTPAIRTYSVQNKKALRARVRTIVREARTAPDNQLTVNLKVGETISLVTIAADPEATYDNATYHVDGATFGKRDFYAHIMGEELPSSKAAEEETEDDDEAGE